MRKSALDRLIALVPPPASPRGAGSDAEFARVEAQLGLALPSDYKRLITTYGDGAWQEFWRVLNPFAENKYVNLLAQAPVNDRSGNSTISAERYMKDRHADYAHAIWPEPGGIFPWATTDNGGRMFWRTAGPSDAWPTIYYPDRSEDFVVYERSTTEIVLGAVTGELGIFDGPFGDEHEYGRADSFAPRE